MDILQALAAHHRETGGGGPIGFADLRRRVGVRDSGRFRYHLEKLRGRFVEKDDGYRLTHAGAEVVAAILAGTYTEATSGGPTELDSDCFVCGDPAVAVYDDGVCRVSCAEDHPLFQWSVPPNAATGASFPEVVELGELLARHAIGLAIEGVCPKCYGAVEAAVVNDPEASKPGLLAECGTCAGRVVGPVSFCLLIDPRVAAFYRRRGRELRERHVREHSFVQGPSGIDVVDEDPTRVQIDVRLGGETLRATVDESGRVSAVDR